MISKNYRLNKSEIEDIKQSPIKHQEGGLLVVYKKNKLNYPKIAVVVSKKVHKLAVQRNQIKRDIIDVISPQLKKHPHLSIGLIFYPSKAFLQKSPIEKEQIIINVFKHIC